MKNIILTTLILCFGFASYSQINFGIKVGASATDVGIDSLKINDPNSVDQFILNVEEANYGFFFGGVLQIQMGWFLLQPEVLFNSASVDYRIEDSFSTTTGKIFSETYQNLDIPFLLGFKAGPLRMQAGPVGHVFLNSISELKDIEGYERNFKDIEYGYQAGIGIDFLKFMIDVRYEGNFSRFGNHIVFFGKQYNFSQNPTRLTASIAITLN
ncbi:outer membrane beta-barrel protein [Membranihabitans maritimus]|uniref:outer membrane beta-barrel protein n=1 Tax=Membranihabitans maritimus TaxID=2904244 RepID=UPI001F1E1F6E|nr:outer membrane beta-barrel protein [Membranihabitans maritimus]